MKKLFALLLCAIFLCACALAESPAPTEPPLEETYFFSFQPAEGEPIELRMDADFAPALALLGEPASVFESESCAFQGLDKVFSFPSFIVYTYPQDGLDKISSIYLMDDMVETAEGAYIGMEITAARALYSEPTAETENSVSYEKGGCILNLLYDADGYVTAITYLSVAANPQ